MRHPFFLLDADGNATVFSGGTLGNEMINPLAQIDNTYNNYNFKQISGNFGLDYTLLKILLSLVIWDSSPPIVNQNLLLKLTMVEKVFNQPRSSVSKCDK
jgi:hypothetical protein